jgi:hypothetical protein
MGPLFYLFIINGRNLIRAENITEKKCKSSDAVHIPREFIHAKNN